MATVTPPTQEEIENLREKVRTEVEKNGEENFAKVDLERLNSDEAYIGKFWLHAQQMNGDKKDNTVKLVVDTLLWRKKFGVENISEDTINKAVLERGEVYSYGRDKEGCKLLVICVRKHVKDAQNSEDGKKHFVMMLENLEKEEPEKKITIMFDSEGAGIRNMEIEAIQFLINTIMHYYPNFVSKIIVYNMPWILGTIWKLVKTFLPVKAVEMIKFLDKSSIQEFIEPGNLLIASNS
eukprot:GFUD01015947.1.p1 GENE.GFUD01015947.1~~GFUD01015947.1.p1  ORF type:complete len:237 (-),score=82.30 GFUD01015947.1:28-738(-)